MFQENLFDNLWYKPLVVLSNSKSILNISTAPNEIKKNIIRVDQLTNYIKKDLEKYDKDALLSKNQMLKLANSFLEVNINEYTSIANKYLKIQNEGNEINLANELKKFRKEKSQKMNVPAYYIFNDKELKEIITHNIKTLEELKNSKILSDIKIKLHGKDIINIINQKKYNL